MPWTPGKTIYRLDLRDYKWTARQWDRLAAAYPYKPSETCLKQPRRWRQLAGCESPVLARRLVPRHRLAAAVLSRLPAIAEYRPHASNACCRWTCPPTCKTTTPCAPASTAPACRATTASSNATTPPTALTGAATISATIRVGKISSSIRSARRPARAPSSTPAARSSSTCPTVCKATCWSTATGRRIDKAPGDIVSDPETARPLVETGLSCMSCHVRGLLPKDDQVRAHVLKNAQAFAKGDRETVLALYARRRAMRHVDGRRQ